MRHYSWVREPGFPKPNTKYRGCNVDAAGINRKVSCITRGDLIG